MKKNTIVGLLLASIGLYFLYGAVKKDDAVMQTGNSPSSGNTPTYNDLTDRTPTFTDEQLKIAEDAKDKAQEKMATDKPIIQAKKSSPQYQSNVAIARESAQFFTNAGAVSSQQKGGVILYKDASGKSLGGVDLVKGQSLAPTATLPNALQIAVQKQSSSTQKAVVPKFNASLPASSSMKQYVGKGGSPLK
jgi:predicted HNH restriction endonuclease